MKNSFFKRVTSRLAGAASSATSPEQQNEVSPRKKVILANRDDGLGERLCGLINAIRLADHYDLDFKFNWPAQIKDSEFDTGKSNAEHIVFGQSIESQTKVFSAEFIAQHSVRHYISDDFVEFPKSGLKPEMLDLNSPRGWFTRKEYLETACDPTLARSVLMSSKDAFERIEFSDEVKAAIEFAKNMEIGAFTALHLRSGDMVFGEPRKWGFWGNKVLNPIVAAKICEQRQSQGNQVLIFGQDLECLRQLQNTYDLKLPAQMAAEQGFTVLQQAFFELVLMSRAQEIICGDSGYTRTAAMIADKKPKSMFSCFSAIDYSDVTLEGLEAKRLKLHPKMEAYCYWQAYAFGRTLRSVPELVEIIEKARRLDPDNLMHRIIQSALLFRLGEDEKAENLLGEYHSQTASDDPIAQQLVFRFNTPTFSHAEQFNDYIAAARRPGNEIATRCRKAIMHAKQEVDKKQ